MIGKLRCIAPMVGACLLAAPAFAQEQAVSLEPAVASAPADTLSAAETVWHMRAALNVAALACRGEDGDDTVRLYNATLRHRSPPPRPAPSRCTACALRRIGRRPRMAR